ncbi:hypothetical protein J2Z79_002908 [Symbiobacterium terraclitae]|uniref:DUF4340 domain-containing protein n=1 Tax=Symbiobacterium terraclitae TaxID=557451 RepID=A0ABS4JV76_9FIRM|nr:hypothetical protein [Symbiobacterium terraclitae]MBP2019469.1 hypothetical protein [Symbiobacterium terraclitae]
MRLASGRREALLNLLLLVLVATSLLLSARIWTPAPLFGDPGTTEPNVKLQPPPIVREMPEVFRPTRVSIRDGEGGWAEVHAGSPTYRTLWRPIRQAITGLDVGGGPTLIGRVPDLSQAGPSLQLHLPVALMVSEWADLWQWNVTALRNGAIWVDRLTIVLGEPASVYLSGPPGFALHLADLPGEQRKALADRIEQIDPSLFRPYRSLELEDLGLTALPDVVVPEVKQMPAARITVSLPDEREEELRYFPDLTVVRRIDERDARSLTDGQRLLRITGTGLLQFRTADASADEEVPRLARALEIARQWVGSLGGWPQDLVLRRYVREEQRGRLEFGVNTGWTYPVESLPGAVQVHVSAAQRVVYFERAPTVQNVTFDGEPLAIITPEAALAHALPAAPVLKTEPVRSMYLTYLLKPGADGSGQWVADPTWVIQAGDTLVYIHAVADEHPRPPKVVH